MFSLSLFLIIGLCFNCALSVVNNHPVPFGEFPYHVSIQNIDSSYHHCGGVIIHPYYVLTAAHCIEGFYPEDFQIVGGTTDLSIDDDMIVHEVAELIPHEEYNQSDSWKNDIGIMKVTEPFQFNNAINSAILPDASFDVTAGIKATVIGFGKTNPNGFTSKLLQEADVSVRTIDECNVAYEKTGMHFTDKQMCAQSSDGAGICKGDSGGALIVNGVVAGISSFTNDDCDHRKYPSVFTKVSEYRTWIDKQIILKSKL